MNEYLIKVGDVVIINIPDKNWEWGYKPVEKQRGALAKVIGFSEIYWSRINGLSIPPGIYVNRSWVELELDNGKQYTEFVGRLELKNQEEYEKRLAEYEMKGGIKSEKREFLRELPETNFWEGDKVLISRFKSGKYEDEILTISGIEYNWKKEGESWTYRVSDSLFAGWNTYAQEPKIELVERGNVWKYYNGETPKFKDLKEEASFYKLIGRYKEVRNPSNGLYKWTKDEVLKAIKEGIVDGFSMGTIPLTNKVYINAVKFEDGDLGRRVREATLKGFEEELYED